MRIEPSSEVFSLVLEFARARSREAIRLHSGSTDSSTCCVAPTGSFETAELNWDKALLADLMAVQKPGPDPVILQRLGETLRRLGQPAGWSEQEVQIQQALKEHKRVVLTLRWAAAELYSLPWELITIKGSGQHLAELPDALIAMSGLVPARPPSQLLHPLLRVESLCAGLLLRELFRRQSTSRQSSKRVRAMRCPLATVYVLPHASLGKLDEAGCRAANGPTDFRAPHPVSWQCFRTDLWSFTSW